MDFIKSSEIVIGTKFKNGGKHPNDCLVIDIHKTYNSKDELIKTSFVATHRFMGQTITNRDVPAVTIQRGYYI